MAVTHVKSRCTFVLLLFVSACTEQLSSVPRYIVDLDKPPEDRWTHIVTQYPQLTETVRVFILSLVPEYMLPVIDDLAEDVISLMPSPYAQEIEGIGTALNTSAGEVLLFNLAYDLLASCTSIVSQDIDGHIWHARNLDYEFSSRLRNLTISVDFMQGGQTQYSVVTFVGFIGALTGQRPGVFTVSVDERDQGGWWRNLLVALLDRSVKPMSFEVRDTLAHSTSFTTAVQSLANKDTVADVYYIVGGVQPGEGAVITKSRIRVEDIWYINQTDNKWFVVETNYDHWKPPPSSDDRRHPAMQAMASMGQANISEKNIFKVMSTHPVMNKDTVYTTIMAAWRPYLMQTWVRHP